VTSWPNSSCIQFENGKHVCVLCIRLRIATIVIEADNKALQSRTCLYCIRYAWLIETYRCDWKPPGLNMQLLVWGMQKIARNIPRGGAHIRSATGFELFLLHPLHSVRYLPMHISIPILIAENIINSRIIYLER